MNVLVVINPHSGNRESEKLQGLIAAEASVTGFNYRIYRMGTGNQETKIQAEIESYVPAIVIGAGGDGTVSLLAKILSGTSISLLIVPYGSANGMAKELGIGNDINLAVSLTSKGIIRKIDLLEVNGRNCIHLADVGLNARIVKRFDKDPHRGVLTYAKYLLNELFLIKQYHFYIACDGKEIKRKAVSITFANASKYGTGAVINPTGKLDDGQFELVVVKPFPRVKLLSIAWKMFRGTLQTSEYVEVICCKDALVRSSRRTTLQVDGEVAGRVKEITISIKHEALQVLVPPVSK